MDRKLLLTLIAVPCSLCKFGRSLSRRHPRGWTRPTLPATHRVVLSLTAC